MPQRNRASCRLPRSAAWPSRRRESMQAKSACVSSTAPPRGSGFGISPEHREQCPQSPSNVSPNQARSRLVRHSRDSAKSTMDRNRSRSRFALESKSACSSSAVSRGERSPAFGKSRNRWRNPTRLSSMSPPSSSQLSAFKILSTGAPVFSTASSSSMVNRRVPFFPEAKRFSRNFRRSGVWPARMRSSECRKAIWNFAWNIPHGSINPCCSSRTSTVSSTSCRMSVVLERSYRLMSNSSPRRSKWSTRCRSACPSGRSPWMKFSKTTRSSAQASISQCEGRPSRPARPISCW